MYPSRFRYEAPHSLDEAIALLRDGGNAAAEVDLVDAASSSTSTTRSTMPSRPSQRTGAPRRILGGWLGMRRTPTRGNIRRSRVHRRSAVNVDLNVGPTGDAWPIPVYPPDHRPSQPWG